MSDGEPARRHNGRVRPDPGAASGALPSGIPRPWWIYQGTGRPLHDVSLEEILPPPPPWRTFGGVSACPVEGDGAPGALSDPDDAPTEPPAPPEDAQDTARRLGAAPLSTRSDPEEADLVNAALILRRPLLVTGRPGTGKSTLAYRISRELGLGRVLRWPITTRSTLRSGLYGYDAVGRVHAAAAGQAAEGDGREPGPEDIGDFLQLGPLGTAMLPHRLPRVLLIDEFDKSDIDLPNDLLDIFEAGEYSIPELVRIRRRRPAVSVLTDDPERSTVIASGRVRCRAFPVVVITSNGEREFPPAFLRRCLQLRLPDPDADRLAAIVAAHLGRADDPRARELIQMFLERSEREGGLAADQLLNAVYLVTSQSHVPGPEWEELLQAVWHRLDSAAGST
ncbi:MULTISPECIES: AAA family ATPase [Streptomyces]|uniref:MoxR-like ATPase n=2 Tax=Streptomyces TaxID=1883 RepID=A0ABT9L4M2_9ACTN|nr:MULTISPECIES: MoxR family ATPase [Streptomyces]MBW8086823.1 MoxR family ATPase [Streptomyces hygroscopicus subsp. hygroscopicus]MDP9615275.1 MoxR-like ATPase [Streptomyces demainii]GHJ33177.1 ATPase AAA [Streptomyces hygroscopicus]